ncbi:MAG: hypothetical protein NMNS01_23400 [Nitrosomonas sp.]|nr:MAG: hypothetical protein NMNS01_23400 [Nitrosomonas sp.]
MATVTNTRDVRLLATSPRTLPVTLPDTTTTSGDHTGTLDGSAQTNFQNSQVTLSSTGQLLNAGGGQLTDGQFINNLNAGNISTGTLFADRLASGSISAVKIATGAVTSDKLFANSVTSTKIQSLAVTSSKIAADAVTTNKIAANAVTADRINTNAVTSDKILANAVTADKINTNAVTSDKIVANAITAAKIDVSTLSAITANLGTVNAGSITGSADINITGRGQFSGNYTDGTGNNASLHANSSKGATFGVFARAGLAGVGVIGTSDGSGRTGVTGSCTVSGGFGVKAVGTGGSTALDVNGPITISTQTISNLTAGNAVNAANATNASNAAELGGVDDSGWARILVTDSGSAAASSHGFVLTSTVSGVRTRATGGRNVVIESFSDERLKFDIRPETLGLSFINKLEPQQFRTKRNPEQVQHGLIAQQVKKHVPSDSDALAVTHEDGMMGVDYISLVSVLVKAVQELSSEVADLKKQVEESRNG